jgi:hypothetical protein
MRKLDMAFVTVYLLLCLGFAVLADELFAASSSSWLYVIAIGLLLPVVLPARREGFVQCVVLGYIVLLVLLPFLSFMPVKPFRQFYWGIHNGMTRQEVRQELNRRFPPSGRFPRPVGGAGDESLCFQLDPNNGYYNAEIIVVKMVDGKVASKQYLPD